MTEILKERLNAVHQITTYVNTILLSVVAFFSIQLYSQFQTTRDKVYDHDAKIQVYNYQLRDLSEKVNAHILDDNEKWEQGYKKNNGN